MSIMSKFVWWIMILILLAGCEPLVPTPADDINTPRPTATDSVVPSETALPPVSATSTEELMTLGTATPSPTHTLIPTITLQPSPTELVCDQERGIMLDGLTFYSDILGQEVSYRVYTPPCYGEFGRRYPYVILMHGSDKTDAHFDDLGIDEALDRGMKLGALPPMIIIMPYGGAIANLNQFGRESYENILVGELIPEVETFLCTWGAREGRAIGGISRGGFWAYLVAFRHPDLFSIVGGHSPFFNRTVPDDFDPMELAANAPDIGGGVIRAYVDVAANDYGNVIADARELSNILTQRQIPHEHIVNPIGGHNDEYWSRHVSEYLAFYGRNWPKDVELLPSCLEPLP
jgi:enterochelin esterase-like enzyme